MNRSTLLLFLILIATCTLAVLAFQSDDVATRTTSGAPTGGNSLLDRAEALVAEGSYRLAHDVYRELDTLGLPEGESRWVDFRLADTLWRSEASTSQPDDTRVEQARQTLDSMVRDVHRTEDQDRIWAEVQESLGDFAWTRSNSRDWGQGWTHYRAALDWWARSADIETARERYLGIVRKAARPPWVEPYYYYGYHGNQVPLEVLRNVLEIAEDPDDLSHAHYLIAMTLRGQGGNAGQHRRTREAFETALENGRGAAWYDDALYHYAQWLEHGGFIERVEGGGWQRRPDFVGAVERYRQLTKEFAKGETRYWDDAQRRIEEITGPRVGVSIASFFLPTSEVQYHLSWRNVERIDLALYPVDLIRDVRHEAERDGGDWLGRVDLSLRKPIRSWSWETNDDGDHLPGQESLSLDEKPGTGAYIIVATGGNQTDRDLILVTGTALVLKTTESQVLAFLCDASSGAPRAGGDVNVAYRTYTGSGWTWNQARGRTDDQGLALFELPRSAHNRELFVAAADGQDQAFATSRTWSRSRRTEGWRVYAFTDRPAYRPDEEVQWKIIARQDVKGSYVTPSMRRLRYEITDPRGAKTDEGTLDLNAFGTAWSRLQLDSTLPLGEYRVTFRLDDGGGTIGAAVLFRLEEYKLPEFKVDVRTPEDSGQPKAFQPGDEVETDIVAEYYFGGPVADASVEVLVYQRPHHIWWQPARDFGWFYEDMVPRRGWWGGPGQIVHRETLTTDAEGRARVTFATPAEIDQDQEFTIEARVTDASRREIAGRGTVRVSRQRYFVFPRSEHYLYRPGDEIRILFKAVDANEQPVATEGRVKVTRDRWVEVWLDPRGREVAGDDLDKLRRGGLRFPPPPGRPGDPVWQLKSQGYEHDDVLDTVIRTGDDGEAELTFTADRIGYYRIVWNSDEHERYPVRGETTVWVADRDTAEVGYHHGGVGIILDKDTFRAGSKVPVMLTAPVRDSWVLFSVEGEDLYDYRLVHLTGTVKLVEVEVSEKHVPNVFLEAAMVHDAELFLDSRQVIVPPLDHFLEVEITAGREEYQPREKGTFTIRTLDHEGRPVPAEVSLGLVDESVLYIQQEYAGDPRQFFYGTKRSKWVRTQSTFNHKQFARWRLDDEGMLVEEKSRVTSESRVPPSGPLMAGKVELDEARGFAKRQSTKAFAADAVAEEGFAQSFESDLGVRGDAEAAVQVRSDFRSTAFWQPDVVTGPDGEATVEVTYPDSLTTWKATARVASAGNQFGIASSSTRTKKPLIVRLQAPRFFVVGDTVTVSAIVNNNTDRDLAVTPSLEARGLELRGGERASPRIEVEAGGEHRVDWIVEVREPGTATLAVTARGGELADAMERSYQVWEHGIEKFLSRSGKVRGDEVTVILDLPRERRAGSETLSVQVTPSLAVTMLDALPYLIDYPYGCTEQTMSRFLPAVITARTLERLGLQAGDVAGHLFGGIESDHAVATHPDGKKDLDKLDDVVRKGLQRLNDFQHGDGGWGWWKEGQSDHFMTAYVIWGLGLAREAGARVDGRSLDRGVDFLRKELVEQENHPDLQAWMLHAVSSVRAGSRGAKRSKFESTAYDNLWGQRDRLNAYTRALLALTAHQYGDDERARILVRNLENGVKHDDTPDSSVIVSGTGSGSDAVMGTAHWGQDGIFWRWSDGGVEATAFVLRALLAIDPENDLVEPVTNWLIKNRRGAQWSNTRDTAITVLTLVDYLETSGELESDLEYELLVNGRSVGRRRVTPDEILSAPSRFAIDPAWIRDGANEIRIVRHDGNGPIYFSAEAIYFSLEEPVTPAGNEIFVRRQYYKLVGKPTLLAGYLYDRVPLEDLGSVASGERVQVVLTIEAKNDYEYLVFEDLKPAGLEAVQLQSGEPLFATEIKSGALGHDAAERDPADHTGRRRWVYQELRDRKVALFVDRLPEGVWEIRYELRAEVPGTFHALPVLGHAMYVPEIRTNGAELRLTVDDR